MGLATRKSRSATYPSHGCLSTCLNKDSSLIDVYAEPVEKQAIRCLIESVSCALDCFYTSLESYIAIGPAELRLLRDWMIENFSKETAHDSWEFLVSFSSYSMALWAYSPL